MIILCYGVQETVASGRPPGETVKMSDNVGQAGSHAFVVRIWSEPLDSLGGAGLLWRGRVEHAVSGRYLVFTSAGELLEFIQSYTMGLDGRKTLK
jgi:hypothetical protein